MRLKKISGTIDPETDLTYWNAEAVHEGVRFTVALDVPAEWEAMTRGEKIAWTQQRVADHLQTHTYYLSSELIFPDVSAPEIASDDFESLPGWASWTGQEAADWIDANVTDLTSAKVALQAMARAIVYLRDIVIER